MEDYSEDSFAINLEGSLWVPYKEVYRIVSTCIFRKSPDDAQELETVLRTYKLDFKGLLKNPPKRVESREAIRKASTEGIKVLGQQNKRILPQAVVDEALIISDLFDLNEIAALELLLMGESQRSRLAVGTRGLAAVLLYYDGRRCLVNSLRALIQVRDGRCWTLGLPRDIIEIVTNFTDDLWEEGLCEQILEHLQTFDIYNERERLENKQALGDFRHRKLVLDLIEEIHMSLAECVYCWACQSGLKRPLALQLLHSLANSSPSQGDGQLSGIQIALLMAMLYSVDLGMLGLVEDVDESSQNLPLIADPGFIESVYKELTSSQEWKCPGLKSTLLFALAVSLRTISHIPSLQGGHHQQYTEEEFLSGIIDDALKGNAFTFVSDMIIGNKHFFNEEFYVRRLHDMVTDFISFFPLKIKELRNRGDEVARILSHSDQIAENAARPVIYFQHLLELVTMLYSVDRLDLKLNEEYWCPNDIPGQFKLAPSFSSPTQKQVKLFKFVRLAGDLLPPLLYVSYVKMLCSLSASLVAAHHCYNLLRLNGPLIAGTHYSIVSWDHFFSSLHRYFISLHQEAQSSGFQQGVALGITPQEIEGLKVVLRLIQTVAKFDEVARVAICGNSEWSTVSVLLGLLNCGVPLSLKAQLMLTTSALVKSPDVAVKVWLSMENSHILPSLSEDGNVSGIIQMELEEIESYSEEYPLTRAMLETLTVLVDTFQALSSVGNDANSRFLPCVVFVINSVLSKFHLRSYKCPEEKWQVASLCLNFLLKLVMQSDLSLDHLKKSSVKITSADLLRLSAGHFIMTNMLQDSLLLKTIFLVVDEVSKVLDQYPASFPGKEDIESSALLSLKLIHGALQNQDKFVTDVRECNVSFVLVGIDQLIMGVNPRTNRADHLVKIAKYISYNDVLPEHAFYSANILSQICGSSISQERIMGSFSVDEVELNNLLQSLVQCLETEDLENESVVEFNLFANELENDSLLRGSTRRIILHMLIYTVHMPPPNLALFSLGFHVSKTPQKVVLQDPGVLDSLYTCLHAVLEILFRENSNRDLFKTAELSQQLIFAMCAHVETSGPTLRYLRTSHDFLYRLLKMLPFKSYSADGLDEVYLLSRQSWLLKTIAIELRVAASSGQRSNLQRLTTLLLDDRSYAGASELGGSRCKLLSILGEIDVRHTFPRPGQLEFFDSTNLERVISECERPTSAGVLAVDLQNLHNLLLNEINNVQSGLSMAQRPVITKELHDIVRYAWQRNQVKMHLQSKKQSLDAWRLVTEMVLATLTAEVLDDFRRVTVILELAHTFLHKVLEENSVSELVYPTTNVLPPLFSNLRQCFVSTSQGVTPVTQPSWKPYSSSLEATVHSIIACILQAGGGPHKVRANYYCAVLNLLKIFNLGIDPAGEREATTSSFSSDNFMSEKFVVKCMDIIRSYGNSFYEILCRDACNSSDVTKMLAICCLSWIISNDPQRNLLEFMASKGYVQDFVNRLQADDRVLCAFSSKSTLSIRKLYVYEAKMAFFVHLAGSPQGARHLLCCGLLKCLADMQAYDTRPEQFSGTGGGPTTEEATAVWLDPKTYYHHILVPALRLILLLINSPSGMVLDIHFQAVHFLVSHVDVLSAILRERQHSLMELQQLSLVATLFAHVFPSADFYETVCKGDSSAGVHTHSSHLHRLARIFLPTLVVRKMKASKLSYQYEMSGGGVEGPSKEDEEEDTLWMEAIVCLLYFYTNMVRSSGASSKLPQIVFGPKIKAGPLTDPLGQEVFLLASKDMHKKPDLDLLIFLLQYGIKRVFHLLDGQHKPNQEADQDKRPTMGIWGLGTQLDHSASTSSVSSQKSHLKRQNLIVWMIENTLYLLWHHLEFYLVRSSSIEEQSFHRQGVSSASRIRRLHEMSDSETPVPSSKQDRNVDWTSTNEDVLLLKADCQTIFTDALFEKFNEIIERLDSLKQGQFLRVIVRRLRWLLAVPSA